ncbi:MAG: Gfo/Idh/MocA family oxidoreductase [Actinomycetota bacterium]
MAASRIAEGAVVEPAASVPGVEVSAVAARSSVRAREAAERWSVPRVLDSYEELIADDGLDAIYIGTPASLHRKWAIAAIEAGKHVLCEKPFAANAEDAALIAEAARDSDRVVMEAFHWRYHPLVSQMQSIVDSGVLGRIERVEGVFEVSASAIPRSDIRWDLALGGGSMMDIGCYPASWVRWLVPGEPTVEDAHAECPAPGIDGSMSAELSWPSDVTGSIHGSMISPNEGHTASLTVIGTEASMLVSNPVAPQRGASLSVLSSSTMTRHPVLPGSTYVSQLVAFRDAVAFGSPFPTTAEDGVRGMELIDACYEAAGLEKRPTHPDG